MVEGIRGSGPIGPVPDANKPHATVSGAQKSLNLLGIGPRLAEDGFFGVKTQAAVSQFQRDSKLPVTGTLNPETLKALDAAAARRARSIGSAATETDGSKGASKSIGSKGGVDDGSKGASASYAKGAKGAGQGASDPASKSAFAHDVKSWSGSKGGFEAIGKHTNVPIESKDASKGAISYRVGRCSRGRAKTAMALSLS